ncbi:MAG: YeaH/YhbH family protein [Gammaproteobacteria bacterium]|nr:YeaH/YhbH family protein [Gammaproteobacteria bacterium]
MANFIDRRLNGKNKSSVNRQRFIRRYKKQIQQSVSDAATSREVTDVTSGESISIPTKDLGEPFFHQGQGGIKERVLPGNDQYQAGDQIARPKGGQGQGGGSGEASDSGEGADEFQFNISKDEYLDLLFEDLELPNLQKNKINDILEQKRVRSGFSTVGLPNNINIVRSLRKSLARRIAMTGSERREIRALEQRISHLLALSPPPTTEIEQLETDIEQLKKRLQRVPFIDDFDLMFNNYAKEFVPSSRAVMFCIMDVSGSMDQATKDIAKRFYILLYLFLSRRYKTIEVIYIRHHTQAKEVDEHEFFYSQETGGTIVSSALKLMHEIQQSRYPQDQWNVYAAQASDGDNWADDTPLCHQILSQKILPIARHFSYIEITNRSHQSLWQQYQRLADTYPQFAIKHITQISDIYPIFRELFQKQLV